MLFGYPSAIAPIADAQISGRLGVRPQRVIVSGEAVTPAFREAVRAAWGCAVLDLYATTETGALAIDGADPQGRHLLEDVTLVEVVDAQERPVPNGERGDHLLITCLDRASQPLIRYRMSDRLILDPPRGPGFRRSAGCGRSRGARRTCCVSGRTGQGGRPSPYAALGRPAGTAGCPAGARRAGD